MPTTRIQKLFFMSLTVLLSVFSFVIYNVARNMNGMSNEVFLIALNEVPIKFIFAFIIQVLFANKLAMKWAFKIVDPHKDRHIVVVLAITCMTICIMCPSMSFIATIMHNGVNVELFSNWLQNIFYNFPFAFFIEIFVIGPFVRFVFKNVFRKSMGNIKAADGAEA